MTDYQGVSLTEAYDNRSVMAQIARIKDRLAAVEQNVDPTLRTDLEAAIADLEALETTVSGIGTQVGTNTGSIEALQTEMAGKADEDDVETALALKADVSQLSDGSVTKVGTEDVGTDTKPVKLVGGVPTAVSSALMTSNGGTFTGNVTFNERITSKEKAVIVDLVTKSVPKSTTAAKWVEIRMQCGSGSSASINGLSAFMFCINSAYMETSPVIVQLARSGGCVAMASGSANIDVVARTYKSSNNLFVCFYFRIPPASDQAPSSITAALQQMTVARVSAPVEGFESSVYEDVAYDGKTIPNITNYTLYPWYVLTKGSWIEIPPGTVTGP